MSPGHLGLIDIHGHKARSHCSSFVTVTASNQCSLVSHGNVTLKIHLIQVIMVTIDNGESLSPSKSFS